MKQQGLPEFCAPMPVSPSLRFLAVPIVNRNERLGFIFVGERADEFSPEDEETLVMFASQAAPLLVNARRFRDEQRTRADLEALIDTSPVGVVVLDANTGVPLSINRETGRIVKGLGITASTLKETLDMLSIRLMDGSELHLREFPLAYAMHMSEPVRAEEIVMQGPGGRSVKVLLNGTPLLSDTGEVETYLATLQDLTPLEELMKLRSEFLGIVSHELRGPLSSIKGSTTTLLNDYADLDPAEVRQFLRLIDQQSDRMRELISDLLDVARIETGTLKVTPEPEDVVRLVDRARDAFMKGGGRRNLRVELEPDIPRVSADRRRLAQVLNNLIANAARFSPEPSPITIKVMRLGFNVAISVSDLGKGVSAEELPNLFRRFAGPEGGETGQNNAGTGLGLSICKGIVEAHGGRIWAESEGIGLGATFTLTLPAVEYEPISANPELSDGRPIAQDSQTILTVDDDPESLKNVRLALTEAGFTPVVTADPEELPYLMQNYDPALVLLDWLLPNMDGLDLVQTIRSFSEAPVIFISAYGRDDVIARAFELGAADYMVKPFSPTEMIARVRAALRRSTLFRRTVPTEPFVLGDLVINYTERSITIAGQTVRLTATEYQLLFELSVSPGLVLTYDDLLQKVWGVASLGDHRLVRGVVTRLRRKLGDDPRNPKYIITEIRVGYRLANPDERQTQT